MLATDATTGRFMIIAGHPSKQCTPADEVPDPVMIHAGKWRVDPGQTVLSENNGGRRKPATGIAGLAAAGRGPTPASEAGEAAI